MLIDARSMGLREFFHQFWAIIFADMGSLTKKVLAGFLVLTVLFLIFGKKQDRRFFGIQSLILLVFCWNPWCMYYLSKWLNMSSRYFRYLWIMPVAFAYGYALVKVTQLIKVKKAAALICYVLAFAALVFGGKNIMRDTWRLTGGTKVIDNAYKVEKDTIQICDIIEADKGDPDIPVKALFGYAVSMDIRTYDPSIYSGLSLADQQRYHGHTAVYDEVMNLFTENKYKDALNLLINGSNPQEKAALLIDAEYLYGMLFREGYQYVIVYSDAFAADLFKGCGPVLGETDNYTIIKIG